MSNFVDESMMIAFIFDSGKLGSSFYGEVVFKHILQGKEIVRNSRKVIVSLGDILIYKKYIDIEPYILNNNFCTIDLNSLNNVQAFIDYPFCWVVEDIDKSIAAEIDKRLKKELQGYIGMTEIDPNNSNKLKQFWKELPRRFAISKNIITVFQDPEYTDLFMHEEMAHKLDYEVKYAPEAEDCAIEYVSVMQSSYVKSDSDLHINLTNEKKSGTDRDIMEMNFTLNRELQISGSFIWKSIIDISKIDFSKDNWDPPLFENAFFALYHASQGIERLQKIIVELICKRHHIKQDEKIKVNDLLLKHNHPALNSWIENKENVTFDKNCRRFFSILQEFYNNIRYSRYADNYEDQGLIPEYKLLKKLGNSCKNENFDHYIKNSFGNAIGKIAFIYYKKLDDLCKTLNIYVYELYASSTATIVYYNQNPTNLYCEYLNRQREKKELLYWLIKNGKDYPRLKYFDTDPLDFDSQMIDEYISDLINDPDNCEILHSEIDSLYDDMCSNNKENWKKHMEEVSALIANSMFIE